MSERITPNSDSSSEKSDNKKKRVVAEVALGAAARQEADAVPTVAPTQAPAPRPALGKLFEGLVAKSPNEKDATADKKESEATEAEVPLDSLSEAEAQEAAMQLTDVRRQEAHEELLAADPNSTAAEAAQQAEEYNRLVNEQIEAGLPAAEAMDAAYEQATGEDAPDIAPEALDAELSDERLINDGPEEDEDEDAQAAGYGAAAGGYGAGAGGATPAGRGLGFGGGGSFAAGAAFGAAANRQLGGPGREVSGVASGLLVGGIVGYLLGRRRGRIRSEKQLIPIQKSLEHQVQRLHNTLVVREAQVRQLAWERAALKQQATETAAAQAAAPARVETVPQPQAVRQERPSIVAKPEVTHVEGPKQALKAEQMHFDDVIKISETIVVGSQTIRQVYEGRLITEQGLRNIVVAHLRGEDIRRVLTEEMLIKELSYERDPLMNNRPSEEAQPTAAQAGTTLAPQMYKQATERSNDIASSTSPTMIPNAQQPRSLTPALLIANIVALVILGALLVRLLIVWILR